MIQVNTVSRGLVAGMLILAGCGRSGGQSGLSAICEGREASRRLPSTIDSVMAPGGAELAALRGRTFTIDVALQPAPATGPAAGGGGCGGRMGDAHFSGELPEPLRGATNAQGRATWRTEGDSILLDLNPGSRDNNLVLVLPLGPGSGHWGLSTFAGEVARGIAGRD